MASTTSKRLCALASISVRLSPKVWFWIKGLFSSRAELADIGADIVQLAANADAIKAELADLDGVELEQLIGMLVYDIGVGTPTRFLKALPALLDAVKAIADFID
jgi:hypothetical protein